MAKCYNGFTLSWQKELSRQQWMRQPIQRNPWRKDSHNPSQLHPISHFHQWPNTTDQDLQSPFCRWPQKSTRAKLENIEENAVMIMPDTITAYVIWENQDQQAEVHLYYLLKKPQWNWTEKIIHDTLTCIFKPEERQEKEVGENKLPI